MDPADISVTYSDTDHGLNGTGPGGSRYTVMVTGALVGAANKIKDKMIRVAGHMLEADVADLELKDGKVSVKGAPGMAKSIAEIALHAHYFRLSMPDEVDLTSGLDATAVYDHPLTTLPSADRKDLGIFYPIMGHMCHLPVIEVDVETGKISFLDYVAVHDCGTMVNPMTLAGHVRGGTAQGIGTALYERFHYDAQRPASDRELHGLPDPDRARGAGRRPGRPRRDALALHRVRHQGRRRRRPHGRPAGARGRDRGRAPPPQHQDRRPPGHACPPARPDPRRRPTRRRGVTRPQQPLSKSTST